MTFKSSVFWPGLVWLVMFFTLRLEAQPYSLLHNFVYPAEYPLAPLVEGPDGMLYGTAVQGGNGDYGTVFKVQPNGVGFTNLCSFDGQLDGGYPYAGLVVSNGMIYGTTTSGGTGGNGTVFAVGTNGAGFSVLWSFSVGATNEIGIVTNADGADCEAALMLADGNLFGTASGGGIWGGGTVFMINTNGAGFSVLTNFSAGNFDSSGIYTNFDGAEPLGGLVLCGAKLYGTTSTGGATGSGTLFSFNTNGGAFTVVRTFAAVNADSGDNTGGANPEGSLVASGETLYGTAANGGTSGYGTVFSINTNGSLFSVVKNFSAVSGSAGTNTDGAVPMGALLLAGTNLFGTANYGGFWGNGSVFLVSTNGGKFTNLYSFNTGNDGENPVGGLWLAGTNLYGATTYGGNWGAGTLFSLGTNGGGHANFYIFDGTDGVEPLGGMVLSGGALYGTATLGGSANSGMVFKMSTNGAAFTVLNNFTAQDLYTGTNVGGSNPQGLLWLAGTNLFGTTTAGGTGDNGTVFVVGTNGVGFGVLWNFSIGATNESGYLTNADGADPEAGLVLSGTNLYGTTHSGGSWGSGVIFKVGTNGGGFTVLRNFTALGTNSLGLLTNADGAYPEAGLILSGTNLYGTAYQGGTNGNGSLFRLGTNGGGFTVLKTFSAADPATETNTDGANPFAGLTLSGTTLFGTTENGGTGDSGTVFAVGTNGAGFTVLWNFSALDPDAGTNEDGANPDGGLVCSGNTLYGTTSAGGFFSGGSLFQINSNGKGFANIHNFDFATDGDSPYADLLLAGNNLFGTTSEGGSHGGGTAFDLNTTPLTLSISGSGAGVAVSWPDSAVGFVLEQNTNLGSTNWVSFPGTINDNGESNSATVNATNGPVLFRLVYP